MLYKDDLSSLNIEDIKVLSDKMSQLVGKLDYDEIKSGNNSKEAFEIIDEIITEIR